MAVTVKEEPAHEYHAHPSTSAGELECFRTSRRLHYRRYVARQKIPREPPSDRMKLGSLLHVMLLQPDEYADLVVQAPLKASDGKKWLRRKGSAHEEEWNLFLSENTDKLIVTKEMVDQAQPIYEAAMENRMVEEIMAVNGKSEVSLYWDHPKTDTPCKALVDRLTEQFAVDLKVTEYPSPEGFAKSSARLGYHRRQAHYAEGLDLLSDSSIPYFFVCLGSVAPYSVGVYELSDKQEHGSLGERQRDSLLESLRWCRENEDWSEPWEGEVLTVRLPEWAFYEGKYDV